MSDSESVNKMLRAVLQSSKTGVSLSNLQSEYRSLCGESIPLQRLGYSNLEDFLTSIPSVVRLEYHMGEVNCFAAVCKETAHIAELVAKQRSSKKSGRSHMVNCRMRFKPSNPYMLNVRPRSSLRQPSASDASKWRAQSYGGYRGFSASGDYRQLDQRLSSFTPVEHRQPAPRVPDRRESGLANCQKSRGKSPAQTSVPELPQSSLYDMELEQSRITQLLEKYSGGMWMSKVSKLYEAMFSQRIHTQALKDLENWTSICMVEQPSYSNRGDRLVYPPLPHKPTIVPNSRINNYPLTSNSNSCASSTCSSSRSSTPVENCTSPSLSPVPKPRNFLKKPLVKPTFIFPSPPVAVSLDNHWTTTTQNENTQPLAPTRPCLSSLNASAVSSTSDPLLPPQSPVDTVQANVHQKIKELLSKYNQGVWAHALPKLFTETYKIPFPEHILENSSLLLDMCAMEYPTASGDKKKAILYNKSDMEATDSKESQQSRSYPLPSGLEVLSPVIPPLLVLPSEQYPSVLVTDVKSSNAVTVRYVGEKYSTAQEAMEDAMHSFYNQDSTDHRLSNPRVGQLVAVRGEDGEDELARAQVMEVMTASKVKVYYVDYGFSLETSGSNLLELHRDFLSLPFQATNVRLAGLEPVCSHPLVLSSLDKLAIGKILLMETLEPCEQSETPMAVLYDTSQDDDINVNVACLKAMRDNTMNNPLTVNVTYKDVCVTNVCSDGIIYCQMPSRGRARVIQLLEETEAFFLSQMTSESLVSRPFSGKFCLARYKGKWSRVEITNVYSNRVLEISFIDLGIPATVEVTDLREIPPLLVKDFIMIPPQAIKCRLADLKVPEGDWCPQAVLWMKEALSSADCKMKILKVDKHKGDQLVYMYLFVGVDSQDLKKSINSQLAQSELWQNLPAHNNNTILNNNGNLDAGLSALVEKLTLSSPVPSQGSDTLTQPLADMTIKTGKEQLPLPPLLELPQPGQSIDVMVSVACHPGHFVLQPWQDLHKLTVLLGEMILYYNRMWKSHRTTCIQKGDIYAAKVDKNWHRVQVKGILANGFVSVYELDRGKHELVHSKHIMPLIEEFRQLPFQAITAQLAGVTQSQWSEEASMLFRNHVEQRALVAQVVSVQKMSEVKGQPWDRRMTVYLVDTAVDDRDLWIHTIIADIDSELSSAA